MASETDDPVTVSRRGHVQVVAMDDGKVNVLTKQMMAALIAALTGGEAGVTATVVTGRAGCLSAGFDREAVTDRARAKELFALATQLYQAVAEAPRPVIVACSGHALAAGALLLLSADFRIGVRGKGQIGFTEVGLGLTMPPLGIALARARLMAPDIQRALLTSMRYGPEQALAAGFLDELVPPGADLTDAATDMAAQLGQLPAHAYQTTRQRLWSTIWKDVEAMTDRGPGRSR